MGGERLAVVERGGVGLGKIHYGLNGLFPCHKVVDDHFLRRGLEAFEHLVELFDGELELAGGQRFDSEPLVAEQIEHVMEQRQLERRGQTLDVAVVEAPCFFCHQIKGQALFELYDALKIADKGSLARLLVGK